MRKLDRITLDKKVYWEKDIELLKEDLEKAINLALEQVDANMQFFGKGFQSPQAINGIYKKMNNIEWTDGFWTGLLWLAYEITNDDKYKTLAKENVESFDHRLKNEIEINHHDIGFLYSLSCVADYKITKDKKARDISLKAADHLLTRYQEKGNFIQAWGNKNDSDNYRLIIDALLNIPLVYWAANEAQNKDMFQKALNHFNATLETVIRDDSTTYHTYFFDPVTGKPLYGKTRQGYSDDSCWARGQSWGVYGIALSQKYNKDIDLGEQFKSVLNVFLNKLPKDNVPFWDLIFTDGSTEPRDSSAGSIVVCGILEMIRHFKTEQEKKKYFNIAKRIAKSLMSNYANKDIKLGAPLVLHSVYSYHSKRGNKGYDEGNIWGDYFYLEMLQRLSNKEWNEYW